MLSALCLIGYFMLCLIYLNSEEGVWNLVRIKYSRQMQSYVDGSISACEDFYNFACANWEKQYQIPQKYSHYNESIRHGVRMQKKIKALLEDSVRDSDWESDKKAKLFYQSCMDTKGVRREGVQPILQFLHDIAKWPLLDDMWSESAFNWSNIAADLNYYYGIEVFLTVSLSPSLNGSSGTLLRITEPPITLKKWNYYTKSVKRTYPQAYKELLTSTLRAFDVREEQLKKTVGEIIEFEYELASLHTPNKFGKLLILQTVADVQLQHPEINWSNFIFESTGIIVSHSQQIEISENEYISHLLKLLSSTNRRIIANYVMWEIVLMFIGASEGKLGSDIEENYMKIMEGVEQPERWKVCTSATQTFFKYAVDSMFVRKHISKDTEDDVRMLIAQIRSVLKDTVVQLRWMGTGTKKTSIKNLESLQSVIGYSSSIYSEEKLNNKYAYTGIEGHSYLKNFANLLLLQQDELRQSLFQQNLHTFNMTEVTATYSNDRNTLYVPAAILQYPFYDRNLPRAVVFGRLGFLIAQRMIQVVDDSEQRYDLRGRRLNWWTRSDFNLFKKKANCFVAQFSNYAYNGLSLRGTASQRDNIAAAGGIKTALFAYKMWLRNQTTGIEFDKLPKAEFTRKQLFFLSFAQTFCSVYESETLRNMVNDGYIPPKYQVIGSLSNLDEFAEEFACAWATPLHPVTKCEIW